MTDHSNLRVVRSLVSLKKQVVESLRTAIGEGRFAPGDRLVERELCEMLDVSRPLLREALSQLEVEGLVQAIPHKGPIVAVYSAEEAKAIYELRATLEEMAGRCFVERATRQERMALEVAYTELARAYRAKSSRDHLSVKTKFYSALTVGAHNPMLEDVLRLIHGRVTILRATTLAQPGRLTVSAAELNEIVQAVKRNDAEGAAQACRRHVMSAAAIASTLLSTAAATAAAKPGRPARRLI
jgi:GntR family transcriptional regulator, trigonelline degradation regulator